MGSHNLNKEEQLQSCNLKWGKSNNSYNKTHQLHSTISWMLWVVLVLVKIQTKINYHREGHSHLLLIKTNLILHSIKDLLNNKCQMLDRVKMLMAVSSNSNSNPKINQFLSLVLIVKTHWITKPQLLNKIKVLNLNRHNNSNLSISKISNSNN